MPWSSNRCWMTSLKKSKDLTIELEVKYLSSTSSWGTNVYIYQLPEGLRMRKILSQMVVGCKRIHKPGLTFCVFLQIFNYAGPKSTYTRAQVFYQWCRQPTPKWSIWMYCICVTRHKLQWFLNLWQFLISFKRRKAIAISWNTVLIKDL